MMFGKKRWTMAILVLILVIGSVHPAFAVTGTRINRVSLRITSDIESGSSYGDVEVSTSGSGYYVEDCYITNQPDGEWRNGAKPKLRVTLGSDEGEYYFKTGFSKSDISISGEEASVTSVSRNSANRLVLNITLGSLDGGNGGYDLEVYDLHWDEDQGHGYWEESPDAKRYEVKVYRGNTLLNTSTVTTTSPTYNFSRYITKTGTYTFRVRAVYNSSYKGDWQESDSWYVDSQLARDFRDYNDANDTDNTSTSTGPSGSSGNPANSNGPGASGNSGAWLQDNVGWWYCNADRSYTVNNWQYINNKWYFFNERGYMVTGWVLWKNLYYYCGPNGDMLTNTWTPDGYYVDSNGVWVQGQRR